MALFCSLVVFSPAAFAQGGDPFREQLQFADRPTLRVVTYNVFGVPGVTSPFRKSRRNAICSIFKKQARHPQGWDVVALQEVWTLEDQAYLATRCGYPYFRNPNRSDRDLGVLILSKHPMPEAYASRYTAKGRQDRLLVDLEVVAHKGVLLVRVAPPGQKDFWVSTTHLIAQYKDEPYREVRRQQLTQMFGVLRRVLGEHLQDVPLIITGDYNTAPPGPWRGHESNWEYLLQLLPGFLQVSTGRLSCTSCGDNPFNEASGGLGKIDHIFASPVFRVLGGGRVLRKEKSSFLFEKFNLSDHYGLEMILERPSF